MNRQISIIVFALILLAGLPLWAQELTDFDIHRVNQRYEITYKLGLYSWGERYDVFFFGRPNDNSAWFKLQALVGQYCNVEGGKSYKVLWEPILDLRENRSYQFRIFAVNHRYLGRNYDYNKIYQIGLVYPTSNYQDVSYLINGEEMNSSVPVALPVGIYEFGIAKDQVLRGYREVELEAFSYIEPELEFQDGSITLTCSEPGSTIKIDGKSQNRVENLKIPIGYHQIEVIPPADLQAIGIRSFTETIEIGKFENVVREFRFPYGKLSLSSNEEKVEYWINETHYSRIQDMKLNPGTYVVKARLVTYSTQNLKLSVHKLELEETFNIVPGSDIKHKFEFKYGYLTLKNHLIGNRYIVDLDSLTIPPNDLKLLTGDHNYEVLPPEPYTPIKESFHLEEGDRYVKTLSYVKDKELIRKLRRQDFYRTFKKIITQYGIEHYFALDRDSADNSSKVKNSSSGSLATGLSISGYIINTVTRNSDYSYAHLIKYPTFHFSLGLIDKVSVTYAHPSKQLVLTYDWLSVGMGISHINRAGTVFGTWETKLLLGGQNPLYRKISVDGIEYKFVREFEDYVPGEDDSDSKPDRYIIQSSYVQPAVESNLQCGFYAGSIGFVYLYGGVRYQEDFGGEWYKNEDIKLWDAGGEKPNAVNLSEFPTHNAIYDGLTFKLGIGLMLSIH